MWGILALFFAGCSSQKHSDGTEADLTVDTIEETAEVKDLTDSIITTREPGEAIEMITVVGPRDFDLVVQEVKRHLITIKWWYHRDPNANREERISVKFTIDQFGIPHDVELIETTFEDPTFPARVIADIPQWRFVKLPGDSESTSVIYPITLQPASRTTL